VGRRPHCRLRGPALGNCAWRPARCSGRCGAPGLAHPAATPDHPPSITRCRPAGLLTARTRQAATGAHGTAARATSKPARRASSWCLDISILGAQGGGQGPGRLPPAIAACSYGVAWLPPGSHRRGRPPHFLRTILVPHYRRAGWRLQRVLTDGGPGIPRRVPMTLAAPSGCATPRERKTASCLDQRLRGAVARDHPAGALARGLPPALFHESRGTARSLDAFLRVLQPSSAPIRATASAARPRPRCFGAPPESDVTCCFGTITVSTIHFESGHRN